MDVVDTITDTDITFWHFQYEVFDMGNVSEHFHSVGSQRRNSHTCFLEGKDNGLLVVLEKKPEKTVDLGRTTTTMQWTDLGTEPSNDSGPC